MQRASFPITNAEQKFNQLNSAGDTKSVTSGAMTADGGCEACQLIQYTPGTKGVSGTSYKSNSPLDLTGAKRIVFFAKGELGGETVQFVALGKPTNSSKSTKPFTNLEFGTVSKKVALNNDWKRYQISLNGASLTGITDPFGFIISKGKTNVNDSKPTTNRPPLNDNNPNNTLFFLKGVTIDTNTAGNPLPNNITNTTTSSSPIAATTPSTTAQPQSLRSVADS